MSKKLPWANKELGQHFLNDLKVINTITDDFKDDAKNIIEIGPGPGILTDHLTLHDLPFHVIEKDKRMIDYLYPLLKRENITFADALKVDYSEYINERKISDELWLVSNLPYNVSTPLLIKFLQVPEIKYMTLMFQKEVADKVNPFATKKNYMGSLLGLSQNYFETGLLCQVPPGAFTPPPKVDSAVITFKRIENPIIPLEEFSRFEKFLRATFQFKRKQLGKVLSTYTTKEKLKVALDELGIPITIRAEALQLDDLQKLYILLKEK